MGNPRETPSSTINRAAETVKARRAGPRATPVVDAPRPPERSFTDEAKERADSEGMIPEKQSS